MFTMKEAIERAEGLKAYGAVSDVYRGDAYGSKQLSETSEVTFGLMEKDWVDM